MDNGTTNFFFDVFCGFILTLAVIAAFVGAIAVIVFILAYGIRWIVRWWRNKK